MSNADRALFDDLVTRVQSLEERLGQLERRVLVTQERLDIVADQVMPASLEDEFYEGHEEPPPARTAQPSAVAPTKQKARS